jgi:L-fucose mutarotase/ribose pyranase (RbsD/FucU family)
VYTPKDQSGLWGYTVFMKSIYPKSFWITGSLVSMFLLYAVPTNARIMEERIAPPSETVYATTSTNEYLPVPTLPPIENKPAKEPDRIYEAEQPLASFTQTRIINLAANISNRLDSALTRLLNIHTRMESRAETMKAVGLDTSMAIVTLEKSKMLLVRSQEQLASIDSLVYYATTAPAPKLAWTAVSTKYKAIATDLRESKVLLVTALAQLKTSPSAVPVTEVASSTDSDLLIP